jgi:hypothetical protein
VGIGDSFPRGKAAGAWSWPFASIYSQGQEGWNCTSTHGIVLDLIITWTTLPLFNAEMKDDCEACGRKWLFSVLDNTSLLVFGWVDWMMD